MVLLTMTPSIVEAIVKSNEVAHSTEQPHPQVEANVEAEVRGQDQHEASLDKPALGKPISHGQIVQLWKQLKAHDARTFSLESLLRGARVYVAPPPPKPEPV